MARLWFVAISLLLFVAIMRLFPMPNVVATIPFQGGSWEITVDTILGIIAIGVAIVFGYLAIRLEKRSERVLAAITQGQIYEKTAMLHGYLPRVRLWQTWDGETTNSETNRIEADILALRGLAEHAPDEQKLALRTAFTVLVGRIRDSNFRAEADRLQAAFDSLNL